MAIQQSVAPLFPITPLLERYDGAVRDALNLPYERAWEVRDYQLAYLPVMRWLYANRGIGPLYWEGNSEQVTRNLYRDAWLLRTARRTQRGIDLLNAALQVVGYIGNIDRSDPPIIGVDVHITSTTRDISGLTADETTYLTRAYKWMFGTRARVSVVYSQSDPVAFTASWAFHQDTWEEF